jgi:hypothetical protein
LFLHVIGPKATPGEQERMILLSEFACSAHELAAAVGVVESCCSPSSCRTFWLKAVHTNDGNTGLLAAVTVVAVTEVAVADVAVRVDLVEVSDVAVAVDVVVIKQGPRANLFDATPATMELSLFVMAWQLVHGPVDGHTLLVPRFKFMARNTVPAPVSAVVQPKTSLYGSVANQA